LSETFQYDHLDRLTSSQAYSQSALNLTYSGSGNIASKSDQGAYTYNQVKVNAVDNIVGDTLATVPSFQQLVNYTSFNKAHTIEDESNGYDYQIIYGPDNQRVKSILSNAQGWERTRYYFGSYEKDSTSSGVKHTWYINSPYGLVAVYIKENTTETLYYAETDHLGSLVALRNTNGTVAESYSYDPWGRRRNPSNWSYSNVPEPVITNRGFTGHEHLDKFNLIDMNGRVYDPVTAGFLSPDIVVQAIDDSRAYNSYSYCYNNPLKAVDPSGYVMMMLPEYEGYSVASTNRALSQIEMRKSGEYSQIDIWRMEDGSWDPMIDEPLMKLYWEYMQYGAQGKGESQPDRDDSGFSVKRKIDWEGLVIQAEDFFIVAAFADAQLPVGDIIGAVAYGSAALGRLLFGASKMTRTFFQGTQYSSKVIRQMSSTTDLLHNFPKSVDGFAAKFGKSFTQFGADGELYHWLRIEGYWSGKSGYFEYIKDSNGIINHRYFVPH
jgi:RHS repeat-associated protein